jgi:oligosaccharide repeat unit polymerase
MEDKSYILLAVSYFLIGGHICFLKFRNKIDLFEPFTIVTIISIFLFNIAPIIFIIDQTTSLFGIYMMEGCIYGTIIYLLSYFSFALGYYLRKYQRPTNEPFKILYTTKEQFVYLNRAVVGWCVSFMLTLLYYCFGTGKSITYVLTMGITGGAGYEYTDTPLKFLMNFKASLISFWLYIIVFSKNKFLKIIITLVTFTLFITGGTRFIIVVMFGSLMLLYYLKKRKRPTNLTLIIAFAIFMVFSSVLGYVRTDLRAGDGLLMEQYTSDEIYTSFFTNANVVLPYYCIVDKIPKIYPHGWGYGYFIEPLYYFLPRALFPWKPTAETADIVVAMNNATGMDITNFGMATPALSELYIEFGTIGCILGMFLLGMLLSWLKSYYSCNCSNIHKLIAYCIINIALFEILNRGYMSMNLFMMIFFLLPIWYMKRKI